MTTQETLDIISKPWCYFENLTKIAQVGRNLALKLRHKKETMLSINSNNLAMDKVVEHLKINIEFLKKTNRREKQYEINKRII